ncbi:MAG: hypothetical protein CMJ81_23615 [Planctomycetaceae bacterium]|nr:hypothetical protein [Planctomycetaceae bacterium]MBP60277.1 hypothetical protein [Planctomycetaceae bacterium]
MTILTRSVWLDKRKLQNGQPKTKPSIYQPFKHQGGDMPVGGCFPRARVDTPETTHGRFPAKKSDHKVASMKIFPRIGNFFHKTRQLKKPEKRTVPRRIAHRH